MNNKINNVQNRINDNTISILQAPNNKDLSTQPYLHSENFEPGPSENNMQSRNAEIETPPPVYSEFEIPIYSRNNLVIPTPQLISTSPELNYTDPNILNYSQLPHITSQFDTKLNDLYDQDKFIYENNLFWCKFFQGAIFILMFNILFAIYNVFYISNDIEKYGIINMIAMLFSLILTLIFILFYELFIIRKSHLYFLRSICVLSLCLLFYSTVIHNTENLIRTKIYKANIQNY